MVPSRKVTHNTARQLTKIWSKLSSPPATKKAKAIKESDIWSCEAQVIHIAKFNQMLTAAHKVYSYDQVIFLLRMNGNLSNYRTIAEALICHMPCHVLFGTPA